MNRIKVAILGGSGYTAVELIKIVLRHPGAEIVAVTSRQDEHIADLHPSLLSRVDLRCEPFDPERLKARGVQVAFGCLPHGTSMESIPPLLERGIRVVDLSADYRLRDVNQYKEWYKETHHDAANLAHAVYGLPEVYGDRIPSAKLIANPGCHPQPPCLGLAPLLANGIIEPTGIIIDSKTGISGGGREPKKQFHYPECNESVSAYGVGTHRHTPEIEQVMSDIAKRPVSVIFTPHLIPMDRGIFSTVYANPTSAVNESNLTELYRSYFAAHPFVRIRTGLPATKDTTGTNYLDIAVKVVRGRVLVLATADNLVRGASGVAVQNFNRMFGFEDGTALA